MRSFGVVLRPPEAALGHGARLELRFTLPPQTIQKAGVITVRAAVNGFHLDPQSFAAAGDHAYIRDVPAEALEAGAVTVEFSTGKVTQAGSGEIRELALVVTAVGLTAR